MTTRLRKMGCALAVLALAGCAQTVDRTGSGVIELRLATIDGVPNANGQSYGPEVFVAKLADLSGGRIKVELVREYGGGSAEAESGIVRAIISGEVDGGWPATRAFAKAGVPGLEAVEAPLTVTSYAAAKELVTAPVAARLLGKLEGTGVLGLGLAVGPLRRPFAADGPLLGPADWKDQTFRTFNSAVQAETVTALGAVPANLSIAFIDQIRSGNLRGAELDIPQYWHNGFALEAGNVTANVVLWPKVFVLAIGKKRFDGLTEEQQGWIRAAASAAVQASVSQTYDESTPAKALCARGVRFRDASPAQVAELRTRTRPVLDRLAADPSGAEILTEIQAIAARHPQVELVDVPANCRTGVASEGEIGAIPTTAAALPEGTYRVRITKQDVAQFGGDVADSHPAGTWTLKVEGGTYQGSCRPVADPGDDCGTSDSTMPLEVGDLRGSGDTVYFVPNPDLLAKLTGCKLPVSSQLADHCGPGDPYRLTWKLADGQLTFAVDGPVGGMQSYVMLPWKKIA
ncbi:TRAP transporter substrate-binding protein [Acrocarpospora macrocephala]|nr:TRAP transporter substrate-binding protein DctP [Acrocarpospora macrocephala]